VIGKGGDPNISLSLFSEEKEAPLLIKGKKRVNGLFLYLKERGKGGGLVSLRFERRRGKGLTFFSGGDNSSKGRKKSGRQER